MLYEKAEMNNYRYPEIYVGMKEEFVVEMDEEKLKSFEKITGDVNPLHNSTEYANAKGYSERVVYGMLTGSLMSTLAGVYLPGESSLIHSVEMKFLKPVIVGDKLKIVGEVIEKNDLFKIIVLKVEIFRLNTMCEKVLKGKMQIGVIEDE